MMFHWTAQEKNLKEPEIRHIFSLSARYQIYLVCLSLKSKIDQEALESVSLYSSMRHERTLMAISKEFSGT